MISSYEKSVNDFIVSFRNELEWKKAAQNQSACTLQEEVSWFQIDLQKFS